MYDKFTHFGELYKHLEASRNKDNFLHNKEMSSWHNISKESFLRDIRYLTLAFSELGWKDKQVAIAISSSPS